MMGLIAIEQLTGPIVASQAMLTSNASAQAGASAGDAAVDAAKTNADLASGQAISAEGALDQANLTLANKRNEMKIADEQRRTEQAKKDAKKDFDQSTIDSLTARVANLTAQEKSNLLDVADKQRRFDDKKKKLAEAEADLRQAKAKSSAGAGGLGRLGDVAGATRASNEAFAKTVSDIVTEINRSYSRDTCLALVTELIKVPNRVGPATEAGATRVSSDQERRLEAVRNYIAEQRAALNLAIDELQQAAAKSDRPAAVQAELRMDAIKRRLAQADDDESRLSAEVASLRVAEAGRSGVVETGLKVCQEILRLEVAAKAQADLENKAQTPNAAPPKK